MRGRGRKRYRRTARKRKLREGPAARGTAKEVELLDPLALALLGGRRTDSVRYTLRPLPLFLAPSFSGHFSPLLESIRLVTGSEPRLRVPRLSLPCKSGFGFSCCNRASFVEGGPGFPLVQLQSSVIHSIHRAPQEKHPPDHHICRMQKNTPSEKNDSLEIGTRESGYELSRLSPCVAIIST